MSENQQVTCPNCGAVGAGPRGLYFCHVCPDRPYMLPSCNGKIIPNWVPNRIKELEKRVEKLEAKRLKAYELVNGVPLKWQTRFDKLLIEILKKEGE